MLSGCHKRLREFSNNFEMETDTIEIPGSGWTWGCLQVLPVSLGNGCTLLPCFSPAPGLCQASQRGCASVCALRAALLSSPAGSPGREFSQRLVVWQQCIYTFHTWLLATYFKDCSHSTRATKTERKCLLSLPVRWALSTLSCCQPASLLWWQLSFVPFQTHSWIFPSVLSSSCYSLQNLLVCDRDAFNFGYHHKFCR